MQEIIEGKNNYDILFLGSSRTYYHINPKIVDSITTLSSFNAGSPAANLLEMNLFLQCYLLSHKAPKIIVIDIAKNSFTISKRPFWNVNIYYPFIDNPTIYKTLKPYSNTYLYKNIPFTRFIAADDMLKQNAFLGHLGYHSVEQTNTYKGYQQLSADTIVLPFKKFYPASIEKIERHGIDLLTEIINTCNKHGIKLVFTYAPVYKLKDGNSTQFFSTMEKMSQQYNIPFWNYREDAIGNNHRLFREEFHLNASGANLYSLMIAKKIKTLLPQ